MAPHRPDPQTGLDWRNPPPRTTSWCSSASTVRRALGSAPVQRRLLFSGEVAGVGNFDDVLVDQRPALEWRSPSEGDRGPQRRWHRQQAIRRLVAVALRGGRGSQRRAGRHPGRPSTTTAQLYARSQPSMLMLAARRPGRRALSGGQDDRRTPPALSPLYSRVDSPRPAGWAVSSTGCFPGAQLGLWRTHGRLGLSRTSRSGT